MTIVASLGVVAIAITALVPGPAFILVGGNNYSDISSRLWLSALAGSILAIANVLVFDALARHAHCVVVILWIAAITVIGSAYALSAGITGLVTIVASVAAALISYTWLVSPKSRLQHAV